MDILKAKQTARDFFQCFENLTPENRKGTLEAFIAKDSRWSVSHPHNELEGSDSVLEKLWLPFHDSFPDVECAPDIFLGGMVEGHPVIASTGYFRAVFEKDWLGIKANRQAVFIRYGIFLTFAQETITQAMLILDIPSLIKQTGDVLFPASLGAEIIIPGPMTKDGLLFDGFAEESGKSSTEKVSAMLKGLLEYDGKSRESMGQWRFWHPKMMWYGPCGIGTTRTLRGFEAYHQFPFLKAFPNRNVADLGVLFGEGDYVATGAMPSMTATHTGGDWLGLPPTNKDLTIRVFDFWRVENGWIRENWVLIDMLDFLNQMGTDVLSRLQKRP